MLKKLIGVLVLCTLVIVITGCKSAGSTNSEGDAGKSDEELTIYTTVYPLQYFAERIAGDEASVESILPAGSDPHNFEPTSQEIIQIAEADAFIYNGAGLESYAQKISDAIESEDVKTVEASTGIDLLEHSGNHEDEHEHEETEGEHEEGHEHEDSEGEHEEGHDHEESEGDHEGHDHGDQDPHVWLDPIRSIELAETIKDTLIEIKPDSEKVFNKNFETLIGELEDLDKEFKEEIENLPGNEIIVSHAAYGYWEQSYGIKQIAISGLSPTNEPSQKELQEVIEIAENHGLKYVFFEQNVTPKVADVVRKEINAETLRIHNLSVLTEEDIENNEDYFTLMRTNLEALSQALIDAPVRSEDPSENDQDHDHSHAHDEESEQIYAGYFEDEQVEDRPLSDWEGDWQSVYPYLQDGTLDEVFAHKAEETGDKTAQEYKEYYEVGYKTNVERIIIEGDRVTFFENGEENTGQYSFDGYEILTYDAGNRGVRYIFQLTEEVEGLPNYIQFSDHSIYPTKADHYHIYFGDDRERLLEEVTNWPTYYPFDLDGDDIADEMMAH